MSMDERIAAADRLAVEYKRLRLRVELWKRVGRRSFKEADEALDAYEQAARRLRNRKAEIERLVKALKEVANLYDDDDAGERAKEIARRTLADPLPGVKVVGGKIVPRDDQ